MINYEDSPLLLYVSVIYQVVGGWWRRELIKKLIGGKTIDVDVMIGGKGEKGKWLDGNIFRVSNCKSISALGLLT